MCHRIARAHAHQNPTSNARSPNAIVARPVIAVISIAIILCAKSNVLDSLSRWGRRLNRWVKGAQSELSATATANAAAAADDGHRFPQTTRTRKPTTGGLVHRHNGQHRRYQTGFYSRRPRSTTVGLALTTAQRCLASPP
ncbi:hypothetical protein NL676_003995 [Syzygium grande]|nr:hypothetical protein NL676_003995 [Syzygium grande]